MGVSGVHAVPKTLHSQGLMTPLSTSPHWQALGSARQQSAARRIRPTRRCARHKAAHGPRVPAIRRPLAARCSRWSMPTSRRCASSLARRRSRSRPRITSHAWRHGTSGSPSRLRHTGHNQQLHAYCMQSSNRCPDHWAAFVAFLRSSNSESTLSNPEADPSGRALQALHNRNAKTEAK
jgi:hypothetical protein